jgi:hypothetical protein
MITVMKDVPPYVAGFTASGEVTKKVKNRCRQFYDGGLVEGSDDRPEALFEMEKNGDCERSEGGRKNV